MVFLQLTLYQFLFEHVSAPTQLICPQPGYNAVGVQNIAPPFFAFRELVSVGVDRKFHFCFVERFENVFCFASFFR